MGSGFCRLPGTWKQRRWLLAAARSGCFRLVGRVPGSPVNTREWAATSSALRPCCHSYLRLSKAVRMRVALQVTRCRPAGGPCLCLTELSVHACSGVARMLGTEPFCVFAPARGRSGAVKDVNPGFLSRDLESLSETPAVHLCHLVGSSRCYHRARIFSFSEI